MRWAQVFINTFKETHELNVNTVAILLQFRTVLFQGDYELLKNVDDEGDVVTEEGGSTEKNKVEKTEVIFTSYAYSVLKI